MMMMSRRVSSIERDLNVGFLRPATRQNTKEEDDDDKFQHFYRFCNNNNNKIYLTSSIIQIKLKTLKLIADNSNLVINRYVYY